MTRQREADEGEKRQLDYDTGLEMVEAVRRKTEAEAEADTGSEEGLS